jgi:hypothetical protein
LRVMVPPHILSTADTQRRVCRQLAPPAPMIGLGS